MQIIVAIIVSLLAAPTWAVADPALPHVGIQEPKTEIKAAPPGHAPPYVGIQELQTEIKTAPPGHAPPYVGIQELRTEIKAVPHGPAPPYVGIQELRTEIKAVPHGPALVDVRPPTQFRRFHIAGSVNIAPFAVKTNPTLKSERVVLIGETLSACFLERLRERLLNNGFQDVRILDGGIQAWSLVSVSPMPSPPLPPLPPLPPRSPRSPHPPRSNASRWNAYQDASRPLSAEARPKQEPLPQSWKAKDPKPAGAPVSRSVMAAAMKCDRLSPVVVDIREKDKFDRRHIPGSVNIPAKSLKCQEAPASAKSMEPAESMESPDLPIPQIPPEAPEPTNSPELSERPELGDAGRTPRKPAIIVHENETIARRAAATLVKQGRPFAFYLQDGIRAWFLPDDFPRRLKRREVPTLAPEVVPDALDSQYLEKRK